jgi:hypothetical protein
MLAIPRNFTPDIVKRVVSQPNRIGVYILDNNVNGFKVGYVGRSDICLQSRLISHNHLYNFDYFIYRYTLNIKDAFLQECQYWHASHDVHLVNIMHPASPKHSGLKCPYCKFANEITKVFAI